MLLAVSILSLCILYKLTSIIGRTVTVRFLCSCERQVKNVKPAKQIQWKQMARRQVTMAFHIPSPTTWCMCVPAVFMPVYLLLPSMSSLRSRSSTDFQAALDRRQFHHHITPWWSHSFRYWFKASQVPWKLKTTDQWSHKSIWGKERRKKTHWTDKWWWK